VPVVDWSVGTYRRLLEGAPDAIVAVDLDGRIVLVNAQTERRLGYRGDELIGRPVEILVPEVKVRQVLDGEG
jgi:PAS domain S-box-containing protein